MDLFQIIAFFACVAVAAAASVGLPAPDATAETVKSDSSVLADSFQYAYETSNGIRAQESGQLKQIGEESGIVTQGEFRYINETKLWSCTSIKRKMSFVPQLCSTRWSRIQVCKIFS